MNTAHHKQQRCTLRGGVTYTYTDLLFFRLGEPKDAGDRISSGTCKTSLPVRSPLFAHGVSDKQRGVCMRHPRREGDISARQGMHVGTASLTGACPQVPRKECVCVCVCNAPFLQAPHRIHTTVLQRGKCQCKDDHTSRSSTSMEPVCKSPLHRDPPCQIRTVCL
jgi:hypothetical protein